MANINVKNKANIDISFLPSVEKIANLPEGDILLIFQDKLIKDNPGVCVPQSLCKYAPYLWKNILKHYRKEQWNCGIILSKKYIQYPAYFVYLLGHELGHACVSLLDSNLYIHCCLIQHFIIKASDNKISSYHELPHEILSDRFGIYIAESLFSREELISEIKQISNLPNCKNKDRLKIVLSLEATNYFANLKNELIEFSIPYKDKLIALWKESTKIKNGKSMTSLIEDYDSLFEYSSIR